MTSTEECQSMSDSALARKRRRELLQKQRAAAQQRTSLTDKDKAQAGEVELQKRKRPNENEDNNNVDLSSTSNDPLSQTGDETCTKKPQPHITGIKRHARYEPGVPMTKKELVKWRKEARRVRNRLSAAESRKKTRSRIEELEEAMGCLQKKYNVAMKRIVDLETMNEDLKNTNSYHHNSWSSEPGLQVHDGVVSPLYSPKQHTLEEVPEELPSPLMLSDYHHPTEEGNNSCQMDIKKNQQQHIIEMISRPQA
mmetsp:Transcript_2785/g.3667  ORF Transcript_2785/g.3667 Transcript_2785/m.3667 type:complete len:253 (-) Transcript_2785:541-1299(-)